MSFCFLRRIAADRSVLISSMTIGIDAAMPRIGIAEPASIAWVSLATLMVPVVSLTRFTAAPSRQLRAAWR